MTKRRVLVSWIGHSDKAVAIAPADSIGTSIPGEFAGATPAASDADPFKALVEAETFDEIRLPSNFRPARNKAYRAWLGKKATTIPVELERPTDYTAIFRTAGTELERLARERAQNPVDLYDQDLGPAPPEIENPSSLYHGSPRKCLQ